MGMCWLKKGVCHTGCMAYDEQIGGCRILFTMEKLSRSLEALNIALSRMERRYNE